MGNPYLEKLKNRTGKSASTATEPETSGVEETAPPAKEPAKSKGKKPSILARMKKGQTPDDVEAPGEPDGSQETATTTTDSAETAEEQAAPINPPKNKRKKKAAKKKTKKTAGKSAEDASTTSSNASVAPASSSTLYVGCFPIGATDVTHLVDFLEDVKARVAEVNDVPHWGMIDFGKGGPALAAALEEKINEEGAPAGLVVDPFSPEARAVQQTLMKHYDVVVWGLR